jgi:chromosome segregation ATPase
LQGLVASNEEGLADRSSVSVNDVAAAALKGELVEAQTSRDQLQQRLNEVQRELDETSTALRDLKELISNSDGDKIQVSMDACPSIPCSS